MTVSVPPDLERAVADRARDRHLSVDDAIREALTQWVREEQEIQSELGMWQEARLEALRLSEHDCV